MKEKIKKVLIALSKFKIRIFNKINKNAPLYYLKCYCEAYEDVGDKYLTCNIRPQKTEDFNYYPLEAKQHPKTAIILQGPIYNEKHFTIETIKMYLKTMPQAKIIVSTWNTTKKEIIDEIKKLGAEVVLSQIPEYTGIGNINYQIKSTRAGLIKAKELGAEFAMKTRTDQRYDKDKFLSFLFSLEDTFKVGNGFSYLNQKNRIIVGQSSSCSTMFIPYFISDFFYFGNINDLLKLFDYDEQTINENKKQRKEKGILQKKQLTIMEYIENRAPELMIIKNYLSNKGKINVPNTVANYWNFVKDNLITLSHDEMQFFWPKYERHFIENNMNYKYILEDNDNMYATYTWNFANWLSLYNGDIIYSEKYEKYKDQKADVL